MIYKLNPNITKLPALSACFVIVFSLGVYYFAVFSYAVNIPFWDEFDAALNWLMQWRNADFSGKFTLMVHQHNEHRMFSYYALVLINYLMLGEINFRVLIIMGNLGIVVLLLLLYRFLPAEKRYPTYALPVLLLLSPPLGNITDMSLMTMNGIFQYFFVLISLWFLGINNNLKFWFAVFFAVVATFSFGNGMLVFLSGYVILLMTEQKVWSRIFIWTAVMLISIAGYFSNYVFQANLSSVLIVFDRPVESMMFFLSFFANNFYVFVGKQLWAVIAAGFGFVAFYGYLVVFRWKYLKQNPVTISAMLFILMSVTTVTISRIGLGIEEATSDRYRLLSALFLALLCISLYQAFPKMKNWVLVMLVVASLIFYTGRTMYGFYKLDKQKTMLVDGMKIFTATGKCPETLYPDVDRGTIILDKAIGCQIYHLPLFGLNAVDY